MKKIIITLFITILFLPICVFARTSVGTEEEYLEAIEDSSIEEISLSKDINIKNNSEIIIDDKDRTIDLNGHILSINSSFHHFITFLSDNKTYTIRDSVGTGKIITTGSFATIDNKVNNSRIVFKDIDYEQITNSSNIFYMSGENNNIDLVIDNMLIYYTRNSPFSTGFNYDIKYLKVVGKNQLNPIGFYNDDSTKYLSDILTNDQEIYLNNSLLEVNRETTLARDIYFSETNENGNIIIKDINKCLLTMDYNGGIATKGTRFLDDKGKSLTLLKTMVDGVEAPDDKMFDHFLINGEEKSIGDEFVLTEDTTIKYIWKNIPELTFKDVPKKSWFYNAIRQAYFGNIVSGYNENQFGPNDKITRGQLVTILWRLDGMPNSSEMDNPFSDVVTDKYYTDGVKWAYNKHIVSGYGGTDKFGPNDPIIRQDLAVILNNYAKYKDIEIDDVWDLSGFVDYKKVKGKYAEPALKWAVKNYVMSGQNLGNGKRAIDPFNNTTRAEACAMITNFMNNFDITNKSEIEE